MTIEYNARGKLAQVVFPAQLALLQGMMKAGTDLGRTA